MRVMVGTVIRRAEDGSALPNGTPIFRELPDREGYSEPEDYYDFDRFAEMMADKYQAYLAETKRAEKEKKKRKEIPCETEEGQAAIRHSDPRGREDAVPRDQAG